MAASPQRPEWIAIGKILTSHGNKGEVRVKPLTDFPERFQTMDEVRVRQGGQAHALPIESVRYHKDAVIIKFAGVDDIDGAIKLKGGVLEVSPEELVDLPPGRYYVFDLLGLKVVDEEGEYIGELSDVITGIANDVYTVTTAEGREVLIPATKEVVRSIDLDEGLVILRPLPGLLD